MARFGPPSSLPSSQEACAVIGDEFRLRTDTGEERRLTLEEVKAQRPRSASTAWRMPYSMFFRAPEGARLPQGLYSVSHPEFGRMRLYLVPRHRAPYARATRYEAVFD